MNRSRARPYFSVQASILGLGLTAWLWGCEAANVTPPDALSEYTLAYTAVKNLDLNTAQTTARAIRKDGTAIDGPVTLDGSSMDYNSIAKEFSRSYANANALLAIAHNVRLSDKGVEIASFSSSVASNFSITDITPPSRIYAGGSVTVEWTFTPAIDGYVLAAVKANQTYQDKGFAQFVGLATTTASLPPDAFLDSTGVLDSGLYYIYVLAYSGAPAPRAGAYPTVLPSGFTNNLNSTKVTGRYGSAVVALHDSIQVNPIP